MNSPPPPNPTGTRRRRTSARARVAADIELEILALAFVNPLLGQDRVARELRARRLFVSASGVRYVWQRHDLETLAKRVRAVEARLKTRSEDPSPEQRAARERVGASRRLHRAAAQLATDGEFQRRRYIVTVAATLFRESGYDGTSLRDIARSAGLPVGSLYYHFPSKDELFAVVYEAAIGDVTRQVRRAVEGAKEPWERLRTACAAHLRMLCAPDEFAIAPLAANLPALEPRVRERLIALNDGYEDIYRTLVRDLALPPAVDPTLLRLQILGAVIWTSIWYRSGKASPERIAANLVDALRLPLERRVRAAPSTRQGDSGRRTKASHGLKK